MSGRLVLMVEGDGDIDAVPILVRRIVTELNGWDVLRLPDRDHAIKLGLIHKVAKDGYADWKRKLGVAIKRRPVGGILVVLDGDVKEFPAASGTPFCAKTVAAEMIQIAQQTIGASHGVSVAVVFACQEFESWFIAGVESLAGKPLPDGRPGVRAGTAAPTASPESTPRDAKGWLRECMVGGYSPTRDQADLARIVDLDAIRCRGDMRSFRRFENAIRQIVEANRAGKAVATPS